MAKNLFCLLVISALALLTLVSGCGTERPIDDRAMIFSLAFDTAPHHQVAVTAERVSPLSSVNSTITGPGGSAGSPEIFFHGVSQTLAGSLGEMVDSSPGDIDLTNLSIIVVSQAYAQRYGLSIPLQLARQRGQTRLGAYLFVSQGSAAAILRSNPQTDSGSAFRQLYLAEAGNSPDHPEILNTELWQALRSTFEPEEGLVTPLISSTPNGTITFRGAALFNGKIMSGILTRQEAAIFGTVRRLEPGLILTLPANPGPVVARISSVHPRIAILPGPRVLIKVRAHMTAIEYPNWVALSATELHQLSQEAAQELNQQISKTYNVMRQTDTDGFSVGVSLRNNQSALWTQVRETWPKDLKSWPYQVQTQVTVTQSS